MGFFPSIGLAHRYGLMYAKTAFLPGSQMRSAGTPSLFPRPSKHCTMPAPSTLKDFLGVVTNKALGHNPSTEF